VIKFPKNSCSLFDDRPTDRVAVTRGGWMMKSRSTVPLTDRERVGWRQQLRRGCADL